MRARHKPWAEDYLKENDDVVKLGAAEYKGKWQEEITDEKPLHVEIGTGKGQFIRGMAAQYPEVHFVGIEVVKSIIVSAVEKVKEAGSPNVTLINENAEDLLDIFEENEVDQIYLNFSDPWPKNRHEKRRLTYEAFLARYKHILKPDGELVLKTDNRGLFEYSVVSFSQFGCTVEEINVDLHAAEDPTNVMTEYEEKFSAKGQPIYRCRVTFPQ
ncbi:tRNA (guanosine(46)-N7)-methyltransferase TrmB [Gracilibacillus sp. S3-1-1]|uniref:tRNA (Guanosine(46)-N7)-methyltransferase TrmB n=1 Tax=Gracilibacillus pellucidus TaxID=3095368 RepID=A0ACC6M913_9BACI|nr:tRNA (guanosine(46)-N7)-methyltransferase TrmB [Gracilibacillus sp. S3-1-1]MDX8047473.1 tRNA (guanosine(46)-N7)-methyltransferase TrmB [Gracilibacillus sp. S3-1-1]